MPGVAVAFVGKAAFVSGPGAAPGWVWVLALVVRMRIVRTSGSDHCSEPPGSIQ
jgi:hypothetical protein